MSVQNSILYSLGCFFNLLFYFVSRKSGDTSFFYGYDNPAVGVLLFLNSTAGITISMVYKYGDAVLKTLAQPVVSAMLLFLSNFLFDMPLDIIKISGAGTVIVSTMLYMQLPAPENDALPESQRENSSLSLRIRTLTSSQDSLFSWIFKSKVIRGGLVLLLSVSVSRYIGQKEISSPTSSEQIQPKSNSVSKFIQYPHRTLGSGEDVQCTWETKSLEKFSERHDLIQRAALTEGICIPPTLKDSLHVFSTAEAIECLSPAIQRCNVNVIFAGDSYTMHLFIGLADIVLGRAWNQELHDGETRRATLKEVQEDLHKAHNMNPSFPKLEFVCKSECYGSKQPFSKHCSDCMNVYTSSKQNKDTVAVVGVGVHILIKLKTVNATAEELKMFLKMANRTIF